MPNKTSLNTQSGEVQQSIVPTLHLQPSRWVQHFCSHWLDAKRQRNQPITAQWFRHRQLVPLANQVHMAQLVHPKFPTPKHQCLALLQRGREQHHRLQAIRHLLPQRNQ